MIKSVTIFGTDSAVCSAVARLLMTAGANRGMFVASSGDSGRGLRGCSCRFDVKLSDRVVVSPVVFPSQADVVLAFSARECLKALPFAGALCSVLCADDGTDRDEEIKKRIRENSPSAEKPIFFTVNPRYTPLEAACFAAAKVFGALGLSFDELLDAIIDAVPEKSRTDCINAAESAR